MNDTVDRDVISQVAEQFTRAYWRMRRGTAKELAPFGITFAQARALRVLGRAEGALRVGDIAAQLEIVPRSATAMVDLLEGAALVARQADPTDRRSVLVAPTPAGRDLLARMSDARREGAEAVFGKLETSQLQRLRDLLEVLNEPESLHVTAGS
jgi:DNA-binding MarR family transcriptional regulator